MRRSRGHAKGVEAGDDSGEMVVGTGVTMDYTAVDDRSLTVSGIYYVVNERLL